MQEYDFTAVYVPGYENIIADYLSRNGLYKKHTMDGVIINESRERRKIATHDITAMYLSHFHSQIISGGLD